MMFIQTCDGVAGCLEATDKNLIPTYASEACINAAITAGCLHENEYVTTLSANDIIPLQGDANRVFVNASGSGYVSLVTTSGGAYSCVCSSPMTYNCGTDTLGVTNVSLSKLNGTCIDCYALKNDIPDVSNYVTYTDLSTCLSDYVTSTDLTNCCYATETCACKLAEDCGAEAACSYFEGCFADCFACYIADWWALNKGNINISDPGRNNSLWVC